MLRHPLNLLTALSLLLCVAAVALWVRSYAKRSAVEFVRRNVRWEVVSDRGTLRLDNEPQRTLEAEATVRERRALMSECGRLARESETLKELLSEAMAADRPGIEAQIARVRALAVDNRNDRVAHLARPAIATAPLAHAMPHAPVAGAAGMLPALSFLWAARQAQRRRARRRNGRCSACGYDLRASPGRCPECGLAVSATDR